MTNRRQRYVVFNLLILTFGLTRCSRDQDHEPSEQAPVPAAAPVEPASEPTVFIQPTVPSVSSKSPSSKPHSPTTDTSDTVSIPDWAADAIWYSIDIDRFHNGDRNNDPDGTLPWTTDWPVQESKIQKRNIKNPQGRIYGGDLQGLRQRLPYLKTLGVNALLLSPVLQGTTIHSDKNILRHINDNYGKRNSVTQIGNETENPATWTFSESDRIFLDLLNEAHRMGFRVVSAIDLFMTKDEQHKISPKRQELILSATRRWMDPNGDGDPSDGVDGWAIRSVNHTKDFYKSWQEHVGKLNPEAVIIGPGSVTINQSTKVHLFFSGLIKDTPREMLDALTVLRAHHSLDTNLVQLNHIGHPATPQLLLSSVARPGIRFQSMYPPGQTEEVYSRWRMSTIFQHFYMGTPLTDYGNEVGILRGSGSYARPPMWWPDLADPKTKSPDYRGDFFALIQWLHETRARYAPIRRGDFRTVLLNDEHRILAFARSMPGEDVILVMNYGSTKQKVMLTAGKPGQLVATLSPRLTPLPVRGSERTDDSRIHRLHVGGVRMFVNQEGKIRMWLNPMSVRVVLINDP